MGQDEAARTALVVANGSQRWTVHFKKLTCVYVPERRSDRAGREAARVVITPSGNELIMSHFSEVRDDAGVPGAGGDEPCSAPRAVAAAG
jgi:hypothetical protein